jgi:hypothetical protein
MVRSFLGEAASHAVYKLKRKMRTIIQETDLRSKISGSWFQRTVNGTTLRRARPIPVRRPAAGRRSDTERFGHMARSSAGAASDS